ncbi:hypothetical protein ACOME3_007232 [Neoechinorhynchus agilis]
MDLVDLDRIIENFKMGPFFGTTASEWTTYVRRFERLLWVKGIRVDSDLMESAKATLLLTYMGDMTLSRLEKHMFPNYPGDLRFNELVQEIERLLGTGGDPVCCAGENIRSRYIHSGTDSNLPSKMSICASRESRRGDRTIEDNDEEHPCNLYSRSGCSGPNS